MLTIDDSLTMDYIANPSDVIRDFDGGLGSMGYVPEEKDARKPRKLIYPTHSTKAMVIKVRSYQHNRIYYNPEIRYTPWMRSDGSSFPNADPRAAQLDPVDPAYGVTNLVAARDYTDKARRWCTDLDCALQFMSNFEPDVYYDFLGGNADLTANYRRIRISDHASFVRGKGRTDCPAQSTGQRLCSQAQEHQNFANWFVYYRTRIFLATAAISSALANQSESLRLGYGRTNKYTATDIDGVSTKTIERGIRPFSGADRDAFFNWLYAFDTTCCTPLRRAVDDVGQYFSRTDDRGPWSDTPGYAGDQRPHLSCRKNYSILITDGAWTDSDGLDERAHGPADGEIDGRPGPHIKGENGAVFKYVPEPPYADDHPSMLADVAMYYWYRDLRHDLPNDVPTDAFNPAFWQHVVQFTIGLGVAGRLDPKTDLPRLKSGALQWSTNKLDDLWHAAINARGAYFSANDPEELRSAVSELLKDIAQREVREAGPAVSSGKLDADNVKFVAAYRNKIWSADVSATRLDATGAATSIVWRASEKLPLWHSRNIYLSQGAHGGAWRFSSAYLPSSVANAISPNHPLETIEYLRGDSSREGLAPFNFRVRDKDWRFGDVVNSSPVMFGVGETLQYQFLPADIPGASTYKPTCRRANPKRRRSSSAPMTACCMHSMRPPVPRASR
ncbi:MAG: hypothetical protein R3E83_06075 [Burkholderiaceae bacterium]